MQIDIQQLSKNFGKVKALAGVDLQVQAGELFFLLGPSGCGKTTLLRCLAGFEKADSGRILFNGQDVSAVPANLRNAAMVFQGYALWPHLTVWANVAFGLEMQGKKRPERLKRVAEVLRLVQIEELAERKPNELSGGQQQRVALARTLVVEPGCLLLDEPLANLDAKLRRDMRREIRRLCKQSQLTGIYVTHDRHEALSMADRIAILQNGRICQVGTPQQLYRRPVNAFVAGFIGESNFLKGKVRESRGGEAWIECSCGLFHSTALPKAGLSLHQEVNLSLRPEALQLSRERAEKNFLELTVEELDYLGELADCSAIAHDNSRFKFFQLNPKVELHPGQTIFLRVAPEDVVILPN